MQFAIGEGLERAIPISWTVIGGTRNKLLDLHSDTRLSSI